MRELRPTDEPIAPAKLAHYVLRCRCFADTKAWYLKVLNAKVQFENDFLSFITYDDEHHRMAFVNMPNCEEQSLHGQGVDHVAFTYDGLGGLLSTYRRLKAEGIEPYWCINHGPTTSLYYRDPENNQIELQIDNFEKLEDLNAWFRGAAFGDNPLGVEFDPEHLIERYERGDPVGELIQQGSAPKR